MVNESLLNKGVTKECASYCMRSIVQLLNGNTKKFEEYAGKALENLKLPEDEEKRGNERVQELINEYNKIVEEKLKDKEKDLMTI